MPVEHLTQIGGIERIPVTDRIVTADSRSNVEIICEFLGNTGFLRLYSPSLLGTIDIN